MDYTEVRFYNDASLNEAIIAWLGENDYDMFEERTDGVNAYIESKRFSKETLNSILEFIPDAKKNIRYETAFIKDQNWNRKWESNFEPVILADSIYVRAPFHPEKKGMDYEIIIEPKMSFGTGHHATTSLMLRLMKDISIRGKEILDMGCGTGILSIFADKLGAARILAIDNDSWAVANCIENCEKNNSTNVRIVEGDMRMAAGEHFDGILANINRNILMADMPGYFSCLKNNGFILLSGILTQDVPAIKQCAAENKFHLFVEAEENNWVALGFKK